MRDETDGTLKEKSMTVVREIHQELRDSELNTCDISFHGILKLFLSTASGGHVPREAAGHMRRAC